MSPTFEARASFAREFALLSREQDNAFRKAVRKLVEALGDEWEPPRSLRVKRVQRTKDVWEMTYSGRRPRHLPVWPRGQAGRDAR